jgi:hypothetical protein
MGVRRHSIALSPHEREILKHLYLEYRIPSDQYRRRPKELARFVRRWNDISERSDEQGEVLHYVVTKRKNGEWVRLEGNHERLPAMEPDFLTDEEWLALEAAYDEVLISRNLGSDNLAYSDSLAKEIGKEFAKRARRVVLPALLFSAIMAKRKRGEWPKLNPKPDDGDIGFSDIDDVAG